jgi:hypothetical protein
MLPVVRYADGSFHLDNVTDREVWILSITFLITKVLVGKLLFKPYKFKRLLKLSKRETPGNFDENCVQMGFLIHALTVEVLYSEFKDKIMRAFKMKNATSEAVKEKIFQDLMPCNDNFVQWEDFQGVRSRAEWGKLT